VLAWLLIPSALGGTAILHVSVPHAAGTTADVAVPDGVGPCARDQAYVRCDTDVPVRFRWSGDAAWALHGELQVAPGQTARAFVLRAPSEPDPLADWLRDLAHDTDIDRHDLDELRKRTVYTSDWTPPPPSRAALDAHLALLHHSDARVRREALEGLHPWVAGTPFDPTPRAAPSPLSAADLDALAGDPDTGVRRRVARILRDARDDIPRPQVARLLRLLLDDPHPGVRRAAIVALPGAVDRHALEPLQAWSLALERIPQPAPPGRAASNQLASLRGRLERAGLLDQVDIEAALERVLEHHPERAWRVWRTWRSELPIRPDWIRRLLADTVGMDPTLVRHWQSVDPAALDQASEGWSPTRHPERQELLRRLRSESGGAEVGDSSGDDSLSAPSEGPPGP